MTSACKVLMKIVCAISIFYEINKSLARANAAGGVQGEGEQQKKSDMAAHYAKKFEELYEVFNKRVGGGKK